MYDEADMDAPMIDDENIDGEDTQIKTSSTAVVPKKSVDL
jgi:hypothetical protein